MNDNEHLTIIESHLKNLLALAEKRTQGKWICDGYNVKQPHGRQIADVGPHHTPPSEYPRSCKVQDEANGAFIAACACNAEAGWKSTLAAIEGLQKLSLRASGDIPDDVAQTIDGYADDADELLAEIIAAFSNGYVDSAQHNDIAKKLAAVTAERDALKAKLATINHIAMSLFVRSTSSEVTGEMAEIGRLSREYGQ